MIIYVPTIPSTGTHFLLNLIQTHKQVVYMDSWQNWQREEPRFYPATPDEVALITIHTGMANEYWDNPEYHRCEKIKRDFMKEADHTVIPIREPLKALLTCHTRNADMIDITFIVNGFVQLAEWLQDKENDIHLFPIDLLSKCPVLPQVHLPDGHTRYGAIRDLFDFLGLPLEPYMSIIAQEWALVNSTGERFTRKCNSFYYSRNIGAIIEELDNHYEGGGFEYLKSKEAILRPFLEVIGYRSLLWWD